MPKKVTTKPIISLKEMTGSELLTKIKQLKTNILRHTLEKTLRRQKNVRLVFNLRKELSRTFSALKVIDQKTIK